MISFRSALCASALIATSLTAHGQDETTTEDMIPSEVQPSEWTAPDTAQGPFSRQVQIADGNAAVAFDLNAPVAGYVVFGPSVQTGVTVSWSDEDGFELSNGPARFGLTEGISGTLTRSGASDGSLSVPLYFYPEMDVTEPNDDALLAWPVDLYQVNETVFFPAGDVDAFGFTLEEKTSVKLSLADRTLRPNIRFVEVETGAVKGNGDTATLEPGQYAVLISLPGKGVMEPFTAQFALTEHRGLRPASNPEGSVPTVNIPWDLGPVPNGNQRVDISLEDDGYYEFAVSNGGNGVRVTVENSDGITREGSLHLARGEYTLIIQSRQNMGLPSFLTMYRTELPDDRNEPNDLITDATKIDPIRSKEVILEARSPIDWLAFEPLKPGDYYFRVESLEEYCPKLSMGYATEPNRYQTMGATGSGRYRVYGPLTLSEEQMEAPAHMYVYCDQPTANYTLDLSIIPPDARIDESVEQNDDGAIYIIGVELNDGVSNQLAAAAKEAEVSFLMAEDADELPERIQDILEAETGERKERSASGGQIWLVLGGAVALFLISLLAFWLLKRSRKPEQPEPHDTSTPTEPPTEATAEDSPSETPETTEDETDDEKTKSADP